MNRRNFLCLAAIAIAGKAAERVFPFRVYSIPKKIDVYDAALLAQMNADMTAAWENTRINGIPYYAVEDYGGTFMNISRSEYPKAILPPVDWYTGYGKNDIAQIRFNVPD